MAGDLVDVLFRGVLDAAAALVSSSMIVAVWVTWKHTDRRPSLPREHGVEPPSLPALPGQRTASGR
jgi:hypothetical protein